MWTLNAAVTRATIDGERPEGWVPEQKITVEEALVAYTRAGAYASFDETNRGMIKQGYLADLAVFDRDLMSIPPEAIRAAEVIMTIVGGEIVFQQ